MIPAGMRSAWQLCIGRGQLRSGCSNSMKAIANLHSLRSAGIDSMIISNGSEQEKRNSVGSMMRADWRQLDALAMCTTGMVPFLSRMSTKCWLPACFKSFPVEVGAILQINLEGTRAGINITVGSNLEEIVLQAELMETNDENGVWEHFQITASDNRVCLAKGISLFGGVEQLSTLVALNAQMPARWCSLDVQAGLGPVCIQNKEGTLVVKTTGGDINLGEIRGNMAEVSSNGGHFEAGVVSANSVVRTEGGNICVNKLVGTDILLDSGCGDVTVGSIYGDVVRIESHGGPVIAKHLQAQQKALCLFYMPWRLTASRDVTVLDVVSDKLYLLCVPWRVTASSDIIVLDVVSTEGGKIFISGLDGNVRLVSKGGSVEIQLHEHAQEVHIDAGGGHVTLWLSSRLTAQIEYCCTTDVFHEQSTLRAGHQPGVFHFIGQESVGSKQSIERGWRGSDYVGAGMKMVVPFCNIKVLSAKKVSVSQRSWQDLISINVHTL